MWSLVWESTVRVGGTLEIEACVYRRAQEMDSLCTYKRARNSTVYPVIINILVFTGLDYISYCGTPLPGFNGIRVSILYLFLVFLRKTTTFLLLSSSVVPLLCSVRSQNLLV